MCRGSISCVLFFAILVLSPCDGSAAGPATRPAARPTTQQVRILVAALSSDDWKERQKAMDGLGALGPSAEAELRARLKENPDAEAVSAIEALLHQIAKFGKIGPTLITLKLNAVSPTDAARAIAREAQLEFATGTENIWSDSPAKIDLDLDGVPIWEALLQLATKAHVALNGFDRGGRIVLVPLGKESSPPPIATAGPFLVVLSRIEVNVSKAKDFAGPKPMNVRNNAFQAPACRLYLFPFCEPKLKAIHWYVDSIDECVTEGGQNLNMDNRGFRSSASGRISKWVYETQLSFTALPEGRKISRLKMTARFVLQRGTEKLEVPNILSVKNSTHLLGGFRLLIASVNKVTEDRYAYEISLFRDGHSQAEWGLMQSLFDSSECKLVDAEGHALNQSGGGGSYGMDKITINNSLSCDKGNGVKVGEPAKLIWEFPSPTEQVIVPLEFRDIELPR